jgi:uncharacterized repeat protein (TIGR03803 family)
MKLTRSKRALLGLTAVALCTAAVGQIDQSVITIHSFPGGNGGSTVWGGLRSGGDGKLYGTTEANSEDNPGTFFSVSQGGTVSTLHVFTPLEGNGSLSSLALGADGNFYGTSYSGCLNPADGCIVRISKAGTVSVLHNFDDSGPHRPYAGLFQASDGNFYGTTNYGGTDDVGTVFEMNTDGTVTLLHSLAKATEGSYPSGTLIEGGDGSLYGVTQVDGVGQHGSVFKISKAGVFTVVHSLGGSKDSSGAAWGLVKGADGKLYGVTWGGGTYGGGTVFTVDENDTFTIVHSFDPSSEYYYPYAALTLASDGKLYGTTLDAPVGSPPANAIFRFDPASGAVETLHLFTAVGDGSRPYSEMIQGDDGLLYGTTYAGGDYGLGTVFRFDIGAMSGGSSSSSSSSSSSGSSSSGGSSGSSSGSGSGGGISSGSSGSGTSGSSSSSSSSGFSSSGSSSSGGSSGSSSGSSSGGSISSGSSGGAPSSGSSGGSSGTGNGGSDGGGGAASPGLLAVLFVALLFRRSGPRGRFRPTDGAPGLACIVDQPSCLRQGQSDSAKNPGT